MIGLTAGRHDGCRGLIPAIIVGFGFALLNWHALMMPVDVSPITPAAPESVAAIGAHEHLAEVPPVLPAAAFPATLTRPLFRATRRPPEAEKPAAAEARTAQPQKQVRLPDGLALIGIVKQSGEAGRALIRAQASDTGQWVEVGYVLEGWRLSQIEAGSILFEAEGRKQSLSLFPQRSE